MADLTPPDPGVAPAEQPTPYASPDVSPASFGAGVGQAVESGAERVDAIYQHEKSRADSSAVLGALGQANDALNKTILSQENGYLATRGEVAMAAHDGALRSFGQQLNQIKGTLTPDQRDIFSRHAVNLADEAFRHVQTHLAQQREVFYQDQFKGQVNALGEKLQQLPVAMNPDEVVSVLGQVRTAAMTRAIQMGLRGKDAENYALPYLQGSVKAALESLNGADTLDSLRSAKALITDARIQNVLGGRMTGILEGQVMRRTDAQEGISAAHDLARKFTLSGTTIVDGAAYADLQKMQGRPDMLKSAEIELDRIVSEGKKAQESTNARAFTAGIAAVASGDSKAYQKAVDTLSLPDGQGGQYLERLLTANATAAKRDANDPETVAAQAVAVQTAIGRINHSRLTGTDFNTFLASSANGDPGGQKVAETVSPAGIKALGKAFQAKLAYEEKIDSSPLPPFADSMLRQRMENIFTISAAPDANLSKSEQDRLAMVRQVVNERRIAVLDAGGKVEPEDYAKWIDEEVMKKPSGHWYVPDSYVVDAQIAERQAKEAQPQTEPPPVDRPAVKAAAPAVLPKYRSVKVRQRSTGKTKELDSATAAKVLGNPDFEVAQ